MSGAGGLSIITPAALAGYAPLDQLEHQLSGRHSSDDGASLLQGQVSVDYGLPFGLPGVPQHPGMVGAEGFNQHILVTSAGFMGGGPYLQGHMSRQGAFAKGIAQHR